ncbi:MAG TPA: serine--tRNA ligase [Candidatus Omnitrophota bacterium]|nr:serine--tRNA ligase [Candidatus Omnitrophota bacterium]
MFDIHLIREDLQRVRDGLAAKNVKVDLEEILGLDQERRKLLTQADELRAEQNKASDAIGILMRDKKDASVQIEAMKQIKAKIEKLQEPLKSIEERLNQLLIAIPNLPHKSVPVGGPQANQVVKAWGEPVKLGFKPKTHIELAENLDIIDFERAAKISGSNFIVYKGAGARLERALFNFMLDVHTSEHGYKEVFPPFVVNTASMTGTGQLPKMAEDMYRCADDDLYLIPTAEVPTTNLHRDEILSEKELPVLYTSYTACFRREAGSYGKETRGLVRVHQFNKVELVKFVHPDTSYDEHEKLLSDAESILQKLGLPYRVLLLASGDMSFAAAKCYDLEAHAAGMDKWLEVSSCSNFEDFQARRANIRFKGAAQKKPAYVHTLNGSGLALARTMVAILENYQTAEGNIVVPDVLRPYMGGMQKITKN